MISCEITIPDTEFSVRMETEIFEKPESTQEPETLLEIDVFSGSASGSGEEDLCESSGEADCGSGYPTDYEVVDENFSKVGVDRGMQEEADLFEPSSSPQVCLNMVTLLFIIQFILLLSN
eukprot:TRINITY_DN29972_c0_g1_i1.p1 TRINITY_DN29972_c0_g1~~TRINITY_DN29972_c0_g1_i1.p1  ORF type:complete len:120 (-),score=22.79 TRINITY_DN29972_c0_g1_i1:59-418(-)